MTTSQLLRYFRLKTSVKVSTCLALTMLADFLFYGEGTGWTLGLFGYGLLIAIVVHNPVRLATAYGGTAFFAAIGLIVAAIISPTWLGCGLFAIAASLLALQSRLEECRSVLWMARNLARFARNSLLRLYRDNSVVVRARRRRRRSGVQRRSILRHWIVPVVLSILFIRLFAAANPVIMRVFDAIDWHAPAAYLSLTRAMFWIVTLAACWALIRAKLMPVSERARPSAGSSDTSHSLRYLFSRQSVMLSLVIFNGLFLVQNGLDGAYLWNGMALPAGTSYAQYAHQGAYPLACAALLAAAFVLTAFRTGASFEHDIPIRRLAYVWIAQTLFMVVSAVARLMGYVAEYSLTWFRIEALIWMGLVAVGLLLILARIALGRRNGWLINANCIALAVVLYVCCFVDFGRIVADYNVRHCAEITGHGSTLDLGYLVYVGGADAIPALWDFEHHIGFTDRQAQVAWQRRTLQAVLQDRMRDWRQWTYRDQKLADSLASPEPGQ